MNPLIDAVFTVSRVLFQHFPIPPTIDDIKRVNLQEPNLLIDAMEVEGEDAAALQRLAHGCSSKEELSAKLQHEKASLCALLPRIADDDDASQRRMDEACAVLDALIGPLKDGAGVRQAVSCEPPREWSQVQKATHALCSTALTAGCDLVAKCSDRVRGEGAELDQHSMNALIPLLGFALDSLRYPQLSRWHKRLAWYAARQLAGTLSVVLKQPVVAITPSQTARKYLLAEGQPVLLPPREGRLEGDESEAQLALSGSATSVCKTVWGARTVELEYDAIGHSVLPRTGARGAAEPPVAEVGRLVEQVGEEREVLQRLDELARKGREMPLPARGEEARFGQELLAVAQQIARVQLRGSLLLPALKEAQEEAKRIEERAARLVQRESALGGEAAPAHPFALADTPRTLLHGVEAWLGTHPLAQCDRLYARGQILSVNTSSGWRDVQVLEAGGASHRVTPVDAKEESTPLDLILHPWNHAPLQLRSVDYESSLARHMRLLKARNASMTDALSGERLDIFKQNVPIEVQGEALEVRDVKGLASQVLRAYDQRLGGDASSRACFVLVADAATGKTVLMSQVKTP